MNKLVLIIDDDPDFIAVYKTILEKSDYRIASAMSAEEGYSMIEKTNPDLIILDIMMENPDSGFELARKLKNDQITIPIILSSSIATASEELFDMDSLNVKTVLQKPVEFNLLLETVKKYI